MNKKKVLIWLPSPLGDAIMATPALRSLRQVFADQHITFLGSPFTREILADSGYFDAWIDLPKGFRQQVRRLQTEGFDTGILFKNSFGSALTLRMAGIQRRVGYVREMRSFLLTDRIAPLRNEDGSFKPAPMVDYYLKISEVLGGSIAERKLSLSVRPDCVPSMLQKLPKLEKEQGPCVVLVPGGAFGPSKLWPIERYAKLADQLYDLYNATVIISVSPMPQEIEVASKICNIATTHPFHIGNSQLTGGELKALFRQAALVITNDTGPRHIAIALDRHVISLFGPNNPEWTHSGHEKEVQIIGKAPCVPCDKPVCRQPQHYCMESITVEAVLGKAAEILGPGV